MAKPLKEYIKSNLENLAKVPVELQERKNWVCWKLLPIKSGPRNDTVEGGERGTHGTKTRMAKVPVNPRTGSEASVTDAESWGSCVEAINLFGYKSGIMGIGYVFTESDPYCGIDIDDCRDPKTGEIGAWAQELISKLDSYTEVSPSGTGVKIIVKGTIPGPVRRRNKVEMYFDKRYFTITGDSIGPATIEERQEQLDDVYAQVFGKEDVPVVTDKDMQSLTAEPSVKLKVVQSMPDEELIKRASTALNGEKFRLLWAGDIKGYVGESEADAALLMLLAYWTRGDHERMDRLFRMSGLMRPKFDRRQSGRTWGAIEIENAVAKTKNFFDPELEDLWRNDTANSDLFIGLMGTEYTWVEEWKIWLKWNGTHWTRYSSSEVREATRCVSAERGRRAGIMMASDADKSKQEFAWALRTGDSFRRNAIEKLSRDVLIKKSELFDARPLLLACGNGVIDLRTGHLHAGLREDYITRGIPTKYNPDAKCPRFDKFLSEIMKGDEEMVAYLWRVFGYILTGETTERAFFLMHGNGRNGKSTLIDVLQAMMGQYSQAAKFETFLKKTETRSDPRDDIAILAGARLVVAQETDESRTLDTALIKTMSGGDKIVARFLYGMNFEFRPTFKLLLVTNHSPKINESSHALWDRLHFIPFDKRITDKEVDLNLGMKLRAELEGILARAVAGCREWQRDGLQPPPQVVRATEVLREGMDLLGQWLHECCIDHREEGGDKRARHSALYDRYTHWAKDNGYKHPVASITLANYLKEKGYTDYQGTSHVRWWDDITVRDLNQTEMREPGEDI